jgi:histidinol dehydrogenase
VRSELVTLSAAPPALAAELRALVPAGEEVAAPVAAIIDAVRTHEDESLISYTREFDTGGAEPPPIKVTAEELDQALASLDPAVKNGLDAALENVRRVGEQSIPSDQVVEFATHTVTTREAPVSSAAVYVPGGRAPYPSTVVMGVATARVAGVQDVAVCSPPARNGATDPAVLAASRLAGASTVYRMGGAQAIAALAYGTETVKAVDVIVGPGNLYVQEAKRQVSARVAIDGFAGPSDLVVIAAEDADPELIALDLLAQAEHGEGTLVLAVSSSHRVLEQLSRHLDQAADTGAVARLVHAPSTERAIELAQVIAPEHLQLVGAEAEQFANAITNAGCVFVGAHAGTAFGDYIAGSNHILPTEGSARFASALSPASFRRRRYEVNITDPAPLATTAAPLARAEGFELHARSMEARIGHNGPTP